MERSGDWMNQARSDLDHARHDLEAEFYEWACFSAQQAAEKAVKAVVQHLGGEAWGHSVADLLRELADRHDVSEDLLDGALELDKSYIPTRYPDAHPSGSPGERYTRSEASNLAHVLDRRRKTVVESTERLAPMVNTIGFESTASCTKEKSLREVVD